MPAPKNPLLAFGLEFRPLGPPECTLKDKVVANPLPQHFEVPVRLQLHGLDRIRYRCEMGLTAFDLKQC